MPSFDQAMVDAIKDRLAADTEALAYIAEIEGQNDRLHDHHSDCKERMGKEMYATNKWRIRSFVVERLLKYLNKLNPFWYPDDLHKEIKMQTSVLFERWERREAWWLD
jgi:hypothetical protein